MTSKMRKWTVTVLLLAGLCTMLYAGYLFTKSLHEKPKPVVIAPENSTPTVATIDPPAPPTTFAITTEQPKPPTLEDCSAGIVVNYRMINGSAMVALDDIAPMIRAKSDCYETNQRRLLGE